MKKPTLLLITLICCLQLPAQQQYRFISYNMSNGLSQNSVQCIFQDSQGKLWLGTQDGLNSFDGKNFKHFKYNPSDSTSLSDHFVLAIAEDKTGNLWIGTGNGLNKLNKRTGHNTRYYLNPDEKKNISANYQRLLVNDKNEIFVPHALRSVFINTKGDTSAASFPIQKQRPQFFDDAGNIWMLGPGNKIFLAEKNLGYQLTEIANAPANYPTPGNILFAVKGTNNLIWFYSDETPGRIFFFDTKTKTWLKEQLQVPVAINHIMVTKNGTGWVSTSNGIYIIKDKKVETHLSYNQSEKNSILPGSILCSYEDQQGNIWIGSANAGFAWYNPSFDNYVLASSGIENNAVTSFTELNGTRWMGTASGLFRFEKNKTTELFKGQRITAITKDKKENVWVSVQNDGLYIFKATGTLIKKYQQNDSLLSAKRVLNLFNDSKDRVFVCTETGYFVFSTIDKWISYYQRNKKPVGTGWYVLNAFEDAQHNIWLSKHLGIDILSENLQLKNQILSSDINSPISRSIITSCTQGKDGIIWIATLRSGIYSYSNELLTQYTTEQGLNSNLVYGMVTDDKGRIWATTTAGINVYVPEEKKFYSLSTSEGSPSDEYVLGALFKNEKGELLAGSTKGLITIKADNIILQKKKPEPQINDIKVDGQSVAVLNDLLKIKPGYKTVSFEFSLKEALQPRNIIYQYRLKGVDKTWNTLETGNSVITYTNLPYNKLTMQVRAGYSLVDMNDSAIDEYSFEVIAPFWKTTPFKVLSVLLIAVAIFLAISQYNKAKYKKQLEALKLQKELQQERSRISRDLHDNIGAYTSALIAGINQLKTEEGRKDENIAELNDYASNIMGYLRETIWVLNNQHLTLTAFTDRFKNYSTRITKNYPQLKLNFNEVIETERELTPQVSLNLFRIMQEALQNACKHADASSIEINFASNHKIHFSIADNGKGISGDKREDSYGLQNMSERAGEIGFSFSIETKEQSGTNVLLTEK